MNEIIGQACDYCGDTITAEHDEATPYWDSEDEAGERHYVRGYHVCCLECLFEMQDGDRAAAMDAIESGLDYAEGW